jgi:hypothetical protein
MTFLCCGGRGHPYIFATLFSPITPKPFLLMISKILISFSIISCFLCSCTSTEEKITRQEATVLADSLEKDVSDVKINFLEKHIVLPAFVSRMYASKKFKHTGEIEKILSTSLAKNDYERNIYDLMGANGSFTRIKQYTDSSNEHII